MLLTIPGRVMAYQQQQKYWRQYYIAADDYDNNDGSLQH